MRANGAWLNKLTLEVLALSHSNNLVKGITENMSIIGSGCH